MRGNDPVHPVKTRIRTMKLMGFSIRTWLENSITAVVFVSNLIIRIPDIVLFDVNKLFWWCHQLGVNVR